MKCGFVILHYLTANDTIECVKSIEDKCGGGCEVVIVDNCSNNGSIEEVERGLEYKNIHIIKNDENLGFARGNNIGYSYCRNALGLETIIVCNNDTIIKTNNIISRIKHDVERYKAAVIGPDIESLVDGGHQNPMMQIDLSQGYIKKEIRRYKLLYIFEKIHVYNLLRREKKEKRIDGAEKAASEIRTDIQLHGAFLIFTEYFTSKMMLAFDERTFLYMEEAILRERCKKNNLVMLFDPNIRVLHKEDSSTNAENNNEHNKRLFVFKNMIKSLKVLGEYLKGNRG